MNKIRLIFTDKCNRNCADCCNKDYDLNSIPFLKKENLSDIDEFIITGGEPLLRILHVIDLKIKLESLLNNCKYYFYTALVENPYTIIATLKYFDGMTLTIHNKKDAKYFNNLQDKFTYTGEAFPELNLLKKSLRLNIFKEAGKVEDIESYWKVKDNMTWIKNCPLPKGEKLYRWNDSIFHNS